MKQSTFSKAHQEKVSRDTFENKIVLLEEHGAALQKVQFLGKQRCCALLIIFFVKSEGCMCTLRVENIFNSSRLWSFITTIILPLKESMSGACVEVPVFQCPSS